MPSLTLPLSLAEFEALLRRIIREEVCALREAPKPSILDDWSHEGPEDPEGDEELLQEALVLIDKYDRDPTGRMTLEEFEIELDRAEAAGELPT